MDEINGLLEICASKRPLILSIMPHFRFYLVGYIDRIRGRRKCKPSTPSGGLFFAVFLGRLPVSVGSQNPHFPIPTSARSPTQMP